MQTPSDNVPLQKVDLPTVRQVKARLARIVSTLSSGLVSYSEGGDYVEIQLPDFTENLVKSIWSAVVTNFSKAGLANGIDDVPLIMLNGRYAVMWIRNVRVFLVRTDSTRRHRGESHLERPVLPNATCLAIGGPSGSGKTTLIHGLKDSHLKDRIRTYVAYTTRPKRTGEIDGRSYNFVRPSELGTFRANPRYVNFVQARGAWYWSDLTEFFSARWLETDAIHLFTITQVHEFLERRLLIPNLQWIWLHASETDLSKRLGNRQDINIQNSVKQNQKLERQNKTELISLQLNTTDGDLETPIAEVSRFIAQICITK